ncbi:unnamed protein product [Dovyalis caffra]|uniref:Uncharacterized protein n=1 Tax=Dovyalis caffra TaxID=77055 RepID=A0AAV1QXQ9_9ROSI|nr:unnamed protein product [Dovyalis caffra]
MAHGLKTTTGAGISKLLRLIDILGVVASSSAPLVGCQLTTRASIFEYDPSAQHVALQSRASPTIIYSPPVGFMWTNQVTLAVPNMAVPDTWLLEGELGLMIR